MHGLNDALQLEDTDCTYPVLTDLTVEEMFQLFFTFKISMRKKDVVFRLTCNANSQVGGGGGGRGVQGLQTDPSVDSPLTLHVVLQYR